MSDKPKVLQDQTFTVEEGFLYKALRTGAIWSNKLFFSSLFLLVVFLLAGYANGIEVCTDPVAPATTGDGSMSADGNQTADNQTRQEVDAITQGTCNVFLHPTSKYLAAMAILSFIASIAFGLVGLVVGKNVVAMARAEDEVGAREMPGTQDGAEPGDGDASDDDR